MRRNIGLLFSAYLIFLILISISGSISGVLARVVYYSAFILPIAFILLITAKDKVNPLDYLKVNKDMLKLSAPLIFPTVSIVIIVSFVTALIVFAITGKQNAVNVGSSYPLALIKHALLPALLEEMLFRYLPMRLVAPYSRRNAIIISSVVFALIHMDIFSIPYAFFAGVVFILLSIATDSVIPSIIIHFINNAISVTVIFINRGEASLAIYLSVGLLALISVIFIVIKRKEYKASIKRFCFKE